LEEGKLKKEKYSGVQTLTYPLFHTMISQDLLRAGGVIVKGLILCNKCRKKMDGVCHCTPKGNAKCLINVYWHGKHYEYRLDADGYVFTYDRAVDRLIEISNAIKKGVFNPVDFSDQKVQERKFEFKIEKWLEQKEKACLAGSISPSSMVNIRGYIKNYYLPFFTGYDVKEIRFEHLSDFVDSLPDRLKRKTRLNILVSLHSFFTWLFKKGVRDVPPFPVIEGIDDSKERTALDYDDQMKYLSMIPEAHRGVLEFGMETGIRPGELVALKAKDIDLKNQTAIIRRTISAYVYILETTKGRSRKTIPLSDKAISILKSHIVGKLPEAFVFINPDTNRRYSVKMPNTLWKRYTGLDITYYEASRHSFCTQLVDDGVDALQAKALLRHADLRSTQKYYHGNMARLRDAVNTRGRIIKLKNRNELETSF